MNPEVFNNSILWHAIRETAFDCYRQYFYNKPYSNHSFFRRKVDITVSTQDVYPPIRITDLKISQVNQSNLEEGVLLTFTAPGDDFDTGKGSYCYRMVILAGL